MYQVNISYVLISKINLIFNYQDKINSISNYGKTSAHWAIKMPGSKEDQGFKSIKIIK